MNPFLIAGANYNNNSQKDYTHDRFPIFVPGSATIVGIAANTSYSGTTIGTASATTKDSCVRILKAGAETGTNQGGMNTYNVACGIQNLGYGGSSKHGCLFNTGRCERRKFWLRTLCKGGTGAEMW